MTRLYRFVVGIASTPKRLGIALAVVFFGCSFAYMLVEHKGPIESMWWAIVTGSTVGYGDFYPESTAGRGVGAVLIISMAVLLICVGANLTARLIPDPNQFTHEEQQELFETLRRQEAALRLLCAERGINYPDAAIPPPPPPFEPSHLTGRHASKRVSSL